MSSQSIWFAYDPQWAASIRQRLSSCDVSDLWLLETGSSIPTPQIILDKYLNNPFEQYSSKAPTMKSYNPTRSDHQTIEALNQFLENQSWRSAVDWTKNHLTNNPRDYQIWFIRFACLLKLRLFSMIESEFETFGNLNLHDKIPFSLRLLHAEYPMYMETGRFHESLDRLFRLLMMSNTILSVLPKDQTSLWHKRRLRILYSISNCYILMKRIDSVVSIFEHQIIKNETIDQQIELYLLLVRILLQNGDEINAQRCYDRAVSLLPSSENLPKEFRFTLDLFSLFRNEFSVQRTSNHPIDQNNENVFLLYMSKLKDSLDSYEKLIRTKKENIHEAIIYNMCTIYELESFRFPQKKNELIDFLSDFIGDGFSLTALKLQT